MLSYRGVALIVEDKVLISLDISDALERAGFNVFAHDRCDAAAAWLQSHQVDVAVLDIELPDGSCEPLASHLTKSGVPFIVYSGRPDFDVTGTAFESGRWVGKPSPVEKIVELVLDLTTSRPAEQS